MSRLIVSRMVFRHRARAQHRGQGKSDQHAKSDKKRTSFTVRIECWPQLSVGTIVVDGLVTIEMVSSLIPLLKYGANATAYGVVDVVGTRSKRYVLSVVDTCRWCAF